MSRSSDDLVDDSSDAVSPFDDVEYVVMDLPNVNNVSNAGGSIGEASVCTFDDVCNLIKKHLIGLEKEVQHFSPKNVMPEFMLRVFPCYWRFKVSRYFERYN